MFFSYHIPENMVFLRDTGCYLLRCQPITSLINFEYTKVLIIYIVNNRVETTKIINELLTLIHKIYI